MKTLKVVLIGAGDRGKQYTNIMADNEEFQGKFKVVAVAEPKDSFRNYVKEKHNIPDEMCFKSWEELFALPKMADVAVISTMDQGHYAPTMKAIELGYDLLLEKPVSNDVNECVEMANAAKKKGTKILVCHVLRYSPLYMKLKEMIDDGMLGKIISIDHAENVGNTHQSHSFVRGNWGNSDRSSPMILQKSCHDMDIMQWLMGRECKKVQSFGSLTYFTRENAPEGSPERCDKTCPSYDTCYYNCNKLYVEGQSGWFRQAVSSIKDPTDEQVAEAISRNQYGQCVYKCDNNVVDHQVVNLEFEGGEVASFNMCAFNKGGRFMRVMGTDGEAYADSDTGVIDYFSFKTREKTQIDTKNIGNSINSGHGGGDTGIVKALYSYIAEGKESENLSEISISVKNHLIAFAAEKARVEERTIYLDEFAKDLGLE